MSVPRLVSGRSGRRVVPDRRSRGHAAFDRGLDRGAAAAEKASGQASRSHLVTRRLSGDARLALAFGAAGFTLIAIPCCQPDRMTDTSPAAARWAPTPAPGDRAADGSSGFVRSKS